MTPADRDWHACPDPDPLLRGVCGRPPDAEDVDRPTFPAPLARRLRLFAVACVREVWAYLPTDARSAVHVAERFAAGRATLDDLRAAAVRVSPRTATPAGHAAAAAGWASAAVHPSTRRLMWDPAEAAREAAAGWALARSAPGSPTFPNPAWRVMFDNWWATHRAYQADLLRDVFPPPGTALAFDPNWRTTAVLELARTIAAAGDFAPLPVLADALEDAGCTADAILTRCRHPGPHVRGSWVVEMILGGL